MVESRQGLKKKEKKADFTPYMTRKGLTKWIVRNHKKKKNKYFIQAKLLIHNCSHRDFPYKGETSVLFQCPVVSVWIKSLLLI